MYPLTEHTALAVVKQELRKIAFDKDMKKAPKVLWVQRYASSNDILCKYSSSAIALRRRAASSTANYSANSSRRSNWLTQLAAAYC